MTDGEKVQLLCFRVGGRTFGVDIMAIREILRNQSFTPVPHTPAHVAGVLNLRGELIPVLDLARMLLQTQTPPADDPKLVVVRAQGRTAGLLVDQVLEVVSIGMDALVPVPAAVGDLGPTVLAAFRREEGSGAEVGVLVRLGALVGGDASFALQEANFS